LIKLFPVVNLDLSSILVRLLMYGFGDESDPAPDTVNVMEELVIDYITEMVLFRIKSFY